MLVHRFEHGLFKVYIIFIILLNILYIHAQKLGSFTTYNHSLISYSYVISSYYIYYYFLFILSISLCSFFLLILFIFIMYSIFFVALSFHSFSIWIIISHGLLFISILLDIYHFILE